MTLNYDEKLVIDLLKLNSSFSTFDLQAKGFCSPNRIVHSLRSKGVLITTARKATMGPSGRVHKRVAHYSLVGGQKL